MKKLFLTLFLLLNLSNISYSDDLSEIVKKLDKIAFEDNTVIEF